MRRIHENFSWTRRSKVNLERRTRGASAIRISTKESGADPLVPRPTPRSASSVELLIPSH